MPTPAAQSAPAGPSGKKRTAPQTKGSAPPLSKKKDSARTPAIPQVKKLSYEKTAEELDASVKMDVDKFFSHCWATSRANRNLEKPYLCIPPEKLRRMVDAY
jgi:hypothetical protein